MTNPTPGIWRHKKRGTSYTILAEGELHSAEFSVLNGSTLVAYRDVDSGKVWFRPKDEFFDGRFERIGGPKA